MTDERQTSGPVAIVTGAGRGIGLAIAEHLGRASYRVLLADKDQVSVEAAARRLHHHGAYVAVVADVSREADVQAMVETAIKRFGRLDALVNNAALADPHQLPLEEFSLEEWNRRLSINLTSVFLCTKYALPHLRRAHGAIVNISSTRALMSEPNTEAYATAKGGMEAFTHALAISCGPALRVNAIRPGWIHTDVNEEPRSEDHDAHPVGRVGQADDIAAMVAYLLSPSASFITGQMFTVDGGMTRKMIYPD